MIVDELGREFVKDDIQLARFAGDTTSPASASPPQLALVPDEPAPAPEPTTTPTRHRTGLAQLFVGDWRITHMQRWNADYYDMDGPAHLTIEAVRDQPDAARGQFHFGLIWGEMDCRCEVTQGEPMLRFSWAGDDEGEPTSGRGWISVTPTEMRGQIFIHFGDDSTFAARRITRRR